MRYEFSEIAQIALEAMHENKVSFRSAAHAALRQCDKKTSQKNLKVLIEKMQDLQEIADFEQERAEAEYMKERIEANEHILPLEDD